MPMQLRVRNFLGVRTASLDLERIMLVGGLNGAGKSSLLEALAVAATMSPLARGMTSKKAAAALLTEGASAGSVTLRYEGGSVVVSYPGADIEQTGRPVALGTRLGIGSTLYMDLTPANRMAEIAGRFGTTPTLGDIEEWFKARASGVPVSQTDMKALAKRVDDSGWDAVCEAMKQEGSRTKGKWDQITGARWGTKVGGTWCPDNIFPDEEYVLEDEQGLLEDLQAKVDALKKAGAGNQARIAQLKEIADRLPGLREELAKTKTVEAGLKAKAEENEALRRKHIDNADAHHALSCPSCKKRLRLIPSKDDPRGALELLPELKGDDIKAARLIVERVTEEQAVVLAELRTVGNVVFRLTGEIAAAERAEAEVATGAVNKGIGKDADEQARRLQTEVDLQAEKIASINKLAQARAINREIFRIAELAIAASPEGVRRLVLERKLAEINEKLAEISSMAAFDAVELVPDGMSAVYGGRPYGLLSESERWRVNVALAVLLHETEEAQAPLLIDRLDVLHPGARPGVLKMLKARGLTTVITMTARNAEAIPDLVKAKLGTVHWLDQGTLAQHIHAKG